MLARRDCCSGNCHDNACVCAADNACGPWLLNGASYAALCPVSRKVADAFIACACGICGGQCPNCETMLQQHTTPTGACLTCFQNAPSDSCQAEGNACKADP